MYSFLLARMSKLMEAVHHKHVSITKVFRALSTKHRLKARMRRLCRSLNNRYVTFDIQVKAGHSLSWRDTGRLLQRYHISKALYFIQIICTRGSQNHCHLPSCFVHQCQAMLLMFSLQHVVLNKANFIKPSRTDSAILTPSFMRFIAIHINGVIFNYQMCTPIPETIYGAKHLISHAYSHVLAPQIYSTILHGPRICTVS
jgi:hypothetical protein